MSRTILTAIVTGALVLMGSAAQAAATHRSVASLSGPYIGSYKAKLTLAEATAQGDARMTGTFSLVLRRNGTYSVSNPLDGRTNGRLAALPNKKLRFFSDSGCIAGAFERPKGGIYRWSISGQRLTLSLVSEGPCTGRSQSLTYPVWKRV